MEKENDEKRDFNEPSCSKDNSPPSKRQKRSADDDHCSSSSIGNHRESGEEQQQTDEEDDNSDISSISGLSSLHSWRPMGGVLQWVQMQMFRGADPRPILKSIISTETEIPEELDDMTMWKIIVNILAEPEPRSKLEHINTLEQVVELIQTSKKIMVLTGAGVSVSCGIPDFRSKDGIYSRLAVEYPDIPDPQAMFDIHYFEKNPKPFFKFAKEIYPGKFQPSPSHKFIRRMEEHGLLLRNYTQNIDTLEQVAGIQNIVQCHGSFATAACRVCKKTVDCKAIEEDIMNQKIPYCTDCPVSEDSDVTKPIMKPEIVFFGESLPTKFHDQMEIDKDQCDLLIVIGSSLKVRPVALIPNSIPAQVPQVLINRESLRHLRFDVELLGDGDTIINELSHRLGDGWTDLCTTPSPARQVTRDELLTPPESPLPSETPDASKTVHDMVNSSEGLTASCDMNGSIEKEESQCVSVSKKDDDSKNQDCKTVSPSKDDLSKSTVQMNNSEMMSEEDLNCKKTGVTCNNNSNCRNKDSFDFSRDAPNKSEFSDHKATYVPHSASESDKLSKCTSSPTAGTTTDASTLAANADALCSTTGVSGVSEADSITRKDDANETVSLGDSDYISTEENLTHTSAFCDAANAKSALFPGKSESEMNIGNEEGIGIEEELATPRADEQEDSDLDDDAEAMQLRKFISLASLLEDNTFLFLPPNRYIFSGAEHKVPLNVLNETDSKEEDAVQSDKEGQGNTSITLNNKHIQAIKNEARGADLWGTDEKTEVLNNEKPSSSKTTANTETPGECVAGISTYSEPE